MPGAEDLAVTLLDTEHILSYLLVAVVLGVGRWFMKQGWPNIFELLKERNEIQRSRVKLENEREMERARLEAESDRLLAEQFKNLSTAFQEWIGEVRSDIAIRQTHTNLLIHILERLNGREIHHVLTPEENLGGGG